MAGAVLVQNTAWRNVERAIANLRELGPLQPQGLLEIGEQELATLIQPAGYFRVKARRLTNLMRFVVDRYNGSLDALKAVSWHELRVQLLQVNGVGPETADSILLYALEHPVFVVDTYTHRIFARHGWIGYDADYHQLQEHLVSELPEDVAVYNELHALLVNVGHHHCRRRAKCEGCPLESLLPTSGIVQPSE